MISIKTSVHIYPSEITYETRIIKVAKAILACKKIDEVIIYGVKSNSLSKISRINSQIKIIRISRPFESSKIILRISSFIIWQIGILIDSRGLEVKSIHAHSLSVLPVSFMIAKMRRAKLIYEPHEFETGTSNSTFLKYHLSNLVERILISRIDLLIVVSECVAQAYETLYTNVKPFVIRNLSTTFPVEERILLNKNIRADLGVKTTELLFIYQGLLSKERGTEQICRAFIKLDMKAHIIFIGNGPYEQNVRKFCSTYSNIHWMNMVPTDQIDTLTRQCDAGIIFLDPSCLNHEYALPNKFFQYLSSGLPVLASDRRQLQVYIDGWKLGWTFQNEIDLVERIQNMNKSILLLASSAIEKFNSENNWEIEEQKLKALYEQVLEEIR